MGVTALIELGGNITLSGFKQLDYAELIVVKKIVGRYARQISDSNEKFDSLGLTLKDVHNSAKELHVKAIINGNVITSEETNHNLFIGLDTVLKKLVNQL